MFHAAAFFILTVFFSSLYAAGLAVPYFHQEEEYTCEAAALKMVLHYYKVPVSEKEIIARTPLDKTPRTKTTWGDPDLGFVGDIKGKTAEVSYGIHWRAMARVAENWKHTEIIENASLKTVEKHLREKRPIIAWIAPLDARPMSWKTPQGKTINTFLGEHTVVITGFKAGVFSVVDPQLGNRAIAKDEMLKLWKKFSFSGIVVYASQGRKR